MEEPGAVGRYKAPSLSPCHSPESIVHMAHIENQIYPETDGSENGAGLVHMACH